MVSGIISGLRAFAAIIVTIMAAFGPLDFLDRLASWYVFLFPEAQVPTALTNPSLASSFAAYTAVWILLIFLLWPVLKWGFSKLFPHLTKHSRFERVMDSRKKFVDLNNRAMRVTEENYEAVYAEFSAIRIECLSRMKAANFRPENYAGMERLDTFDNVDGPNKYSVHIRSMCRKAITVIKEAIDNEKRHS